LTEGLRDSGGGDAGHALCLNYIVTFSLQLNKITENVSLGSRKVLGTLHCGDLAAFVQVAWTACLFPVAFGQDLGPLLSFVGHSTFQAAELWVPSTSQF